MKEMITVEKEVYEAVLRNSIKVCDLEAENQQLKELLKECREVIEWYKADCGYKDTPTEAVLTKIDNAIGEKK